MKNLPNMQMFMWQQKTEASGTKGNVLNAIQEKALEGRCDLCLRPDSDASCH